jgi:hypothetical protein
MSRTMSLKPTRTYRGVILRRYSFQAPDFWYQACPVESYVDSDGTLYEYNEAVAYGPFSTRAAAQGAITRNKLRSRDDGTLYSSNYESQYTFIEETSAVWTKTK